MIDADKLIYKDDVLEVQPYVSTVGIDYFQLGCVRVGLTCEVRVRES